jgi:hypothetical protein
LGILDSSESVDKIDEYIDIFSSSPFWSAKKETDLVTLGVGAREGMGEVTRSDVVEKSRDGVGKRPRSVWVENDISSCGEIKTNDGVG